MKVRKRSKGLTPRERKILNARIAGKTMRAIGMEKHGLTDDTLIEKYLVPALAAKEAVCRVD